MPTIEDIADEILAREGGYVNDPDDPGDPDDPDDPDDLDDPEDAERLFM